MEEAYIRRESRGKKRMFDRGREVEEANAPAEAMKGVRGTEKCVSDKSREKNQKKRQAQRES